MLARKQSELQKAGGRSTIWTGFDARDGSVRLGRQSILSAAMAAAALLAVIAFGTGEPAAATLDDMRQSGTARIAYREDAVPFWLKNAVGKPAGLMVNLCRAVVAKVAADLSTAEIKITYVPVTAANRFETIEKGQADLLCEATSQTLARLNSPLTKSGLIDSL